jgi:hypothetical protein
LNGESPVAPTGKRAADLAAPVRITAGGKPIDVDGFAAPLFGDFDEDGKNDLLVGQLDYGRLRIYRNSGTNAQPKFEPFEWFQAGGRIAGIPAGCAVGFTPQLVDFDGDGRTDVVTGSFSFVGGPLFVFRRNPDGTFAEAEVLENKHGDVLVGRLPSNVPQNRYNTTAFVHDWEGDGDGDLIVGRRPCLVLNERAGHKPVFGDAEQLRIGGEPIAGGRVPPCMADWDGDGRYDLLIGRQADVVWYRNTGTKDKPVFQGPQILVSADDLGPRNDDGPDHERRKPSRHVYSICVADFNADGRPDLLLGDHYHLTRSLTDKQRARYAEAAEKRRSFWHDYCKLVDEWPENDTREARIERMRQTLRKWDELSSVPWIGVQASQSRFERHGGVWFFERIAPACQNNEQSSLRGHVQSVVEKYAQADDEYRRLLTRAKSENTSGGKEPVSCPEQASMSTRVPASMKSWPRRSFSGSCRRFPEGRTVRCGALIFFYRQVRNRDYPSSVQPSRYLRLSRALASSLLVTRPVWPS